MLRSGPCCPKAEAVARAAPKLKAARTPALNRVPECQWFYSVASPGIVGIGTHSAAPLPQVSCRQRRPVRLFHADRVVALKLLPVSVHDIGAAAFRRQQMRAIAAADWHYTGITKWEVKVGSAMQDGVIVRVATRSV